MRRKQRAVAIAVAAGMAFPLPAVAASAAPAAQPGTQAVTLITGDRIRVLPGARGPAAVVVEPGPGRGGIGFVRDTSTGGRPGELSVVPSDALPLLAAGRLDPRLFDVSELLRQRLADPAPRLPLIVTYTAAARPSAAAATTVRDLPSVHGAALH